MKEIQFQSCRAPTQYSKENVGLFQESTELVQGVISKEMSWQTRQFCDTLSAPHPSAERMNG